MTKSERYRYVFHAPEGISGYEMNGNGPSRTKDLPWVAIPRGRVSKENKMVIARRRFATEREAAMYVDKWMIEKGRKPLNILKPRP